MSAPLHRPFKSVLIANRGEIAVRIVREAQAAGLRAIAVYSDADKNALHVQRADTAVHIGASPARESYLDVGKILAAAKQTSAEAIHPGYGFLSENPDFARGVIDAGFVWIGPSPDAIRAMGDKGAAKQIARKAEVPVIPGYDGDDQSDAHLLTEAKKIGWPVLIKAANGGGGRGQRRVTSEGHFADDLASARRESLSAFASDKVILERALDHVRHIEVQIFGDAHGNIIHLGERDCSIQRRNQKIIEEAPAPGVSEDLRARMGDAAVRLARAVNYTNAGTVEFLLDRDGKFYFLEMNTRIQVEHPVTEEVTGTNLIQWQFDVAAGKPLPLKQSELRITGHAIEARLCAEDPADDFRPQVGALLYADFERRGALSRVDTGVLGNTIVSADYDSMIAKVIGKGSTRNEARSNLIDALSTIMVRGIRTNRTFLIELLGAPELIAGTPDIGWLTRQPKPVDDNLSGLLGQIAALYLAHGNGGAWSSTGYRRTTIRLRERTADQSLVVENACCKGTTLVDLDQVKGSPIATATVVTDDGHRIKASVDHKNSVHVDVGTNTAIFEDITYAPAERKDAAGDGAVRAPMAGKIVRVNVEPGAKVEKGQVLVILEAMKMEHEITARTAGTATAVSAKVGDQVANRQVLVTITAS